MPQGKLMDTFLRKLDQIAPQSGILSSSAFIMQMILMTYSKYLFLSKSLQVFEIGQVMQ